jgi:WD40 repeat protein
MESNSTKYHATLAEYFAGKPLYLDEAEKKKPNTRKLVELPWQQTKAEMWDEVIHTLCDLLFIEAKGVAGMTFVSMEDYHYALDGLPERQTEIAEEKRRKACLDIWTKEIIDYSRRWSEYHQQKKGLLDKLLKSGRPKAIIPDPIRSNRLWTQNEIEAECRRITENPNRLDRLHAFFNFLGQECHMIHIYSRLPGFTLQHAFNFAPNGFVHVEADAKIGQANSYMSLRQWSPQSDYSPKSAVIYTLMGHTDIVTSVIITPDGRRAISGSLDATLRVWDLQTSDCLMVLRGYSYGCMDLTPDGRLLVFVNTNKAEIWDLEKGTCIRNLKGDGKTTLSLSITPDARMAIAAINNKTLRFWNLETGDNIHILEGHELDATSVSMTPDGLIAVSSSHDKTLRIWDLQKGSCIRVLNGQGDSFTEVKITADALRVVSFGSGRIRVWDLNTGSCLKSINVNMEVGGKFSITPDGSRIIVINFNNSLGVWDLETGECLRILDGHNDNVNGICITADGLRAISASNDRILLVWDLEKGRCLKNDSGKIVKISTSLKESIAVSAMETSVYNRYDSSAKIWDLKTGSMLQRLKGNFGNSIHSLCIMPNDPHFVFADDGKTMRIWDFKSGVCQLEFKSINGVSCLTPDGKIIVSGGHDNKVYLWDPESGDCLKTMNGHSDRIYSIKVTSDGLRIVTASHDETLRIWELKTGLCMHILKGNHNGTGIRKVFLSTDGFYAISIGGLEWDLEVWDLKKGIRLRTLKGHQSYVTSVGILPYGNRAISSSEDHTLRIWNFETGDCLHILEGHSDKILGIIVMPCGKIAVSAGQDRTLRTWNMETGTCLSVIRGNAPWVEIEIAGDNSIIAGSKTGEVAIYNFRRPKE